MELKIRIPSPQDPGYLRRQRELLKYSAIFSDLETKPTPEALDKLVDFVLNFVTEPAEKEEAREALWDASEEDFLSILEALGGENAEVPKEKGGKSNPGISQE